MRLFNSVTLVCVSLLFVGCQKADPLNRQAVSGKITLDDQPLQAGTIEFSPVESGTMSGALIEDGVFSISAEKGLSPGAYIVRISAANADDEPVDLPGESNKIAPELIPAKYNSESELTFTVQADSENTFDVDIKTNQE